MITCGALQLAVGLVKTNWRTDVRGMAGSEGVLDGPLDGN